MFTHRFIAGVILAITASVAVADDKTTVEVFFAAENVPEGLKVGDKVDLKAITGKSVTGTGVTSLTTMNVVQNIEVASIAKVEKPKSPEEALKVEVRATKEQAEKIERFKKQMVTTVVRNPGGAPEQKRMPIPLRLELSKGEKK
jgi:hypothetical protein